MPRKKCFSDIIFSGIRPNYKQKGLLSLNYCCPINVKKSRKDRLNR
ncbi:hypothetical protein GCWU000325_02769 [Alloprevotella tannerae ATCC 51259]|uniref:Uncharacterized protein n=1 Tax=Alloprevotella tannerae ATCC 51259 TaxID=626522 RepID=C9LKK3_9BACT|nr:hypothetical protein GCWU000325_02769 [Alloprevotella tannerae ATCC 51259]